MITELEYNKLKNKYNTYHTARGSLTSITPEIAKTLPEKCTNDEISAIEVYEFVNNPPEKYFIYVNSDQDIVTTWTGEKLGVCSFGKEFKGNLGDTRQSIFIYGINGKEYYGIYYKSAGDYARITAYKEYGEN